MKKFLLVGIAIAALAGCQNMHTLGGATLGGLGGAYGGSMVGKGKGRLAATAAGALLGAGTGGYLGSFFDQVNQNSFGIQQLSNRPTQSPAPIIYTTPSPAANYNQNQNGYQVPLQCRVVNNYVNCASN
jgi:uncharacterized protein YcfJ